MKVKLMSFGCFGLLIAAQFLHAEEGWQRLEREIYTDQNVRDLIQQIERDRASQNFWNTDPVAKAVAKSQEEIFHGVLEQSVSKTATAPNVFEFTFKNHSGAELSLLKFRPRGGRWSDNVLADNVMFNYLNDYGLSLEFRGTSDSSGSPAFKTISTMVRNMDGQSVPGHAQYVAVPTGLSSCSSVELMLGFGSGKVCRYDFNGSRASFYIYVNRIEVFDGMDRYGNMRSVTLRPE